MSLLILASSGAVAETDTKTSLVSLPPEVQKAIRDATAFAAFPVDTPNTFFGSVALVTDELIFDPGAGLILDPGGESFVVIYAKKLIRLKSSTANSISHAVPVLRPGTVGADGQSGTSHNQEAGRPGGRGSTGAVGDSGRSFTPPMLYLIVDSLVELDRPPLGFVPFRIDATAADGTEGGRGGDGGSGGAGEAGSPAQAASGWCEIPPGTGGDGGDGGDAGDGGLGGDGGNGGQVLLGGTSSFIAKAKAFDYVLPGGRKGAGGQPGVPGQGGAPGAAGYELSDCPKGSEGASGLDGQPAKPGADGRDGVAGAFRPLSVGAR